MKIYTLNLPGGIRKVRAVSGKSAISKVFDMKMKKKAIKKKKKITIKKEKNGASI